MKCFYHDDMDGKAAAFVVSIVARTQRPAGTDCEFIAMDYGKPFPAEAIADGEEVWIVDFSIEPAVMDELLAITEHVVWIDHHKTAIEKYYHYTNWRPGSVYRIGEDAGCVLTWRYCFPDKPLPRAIELVGDRDVWKWEFGQETANFYAGASMMDTDPTSDFWRHMLNDSHQFIRVLDQGGIINAYTARHNASLFKRIGFVAYMVDGNKKMYRCLCMNVCGTGSEVFGDGAIDEHAILSTFYWDGTQFTVSLYSNQIDVSEIAKLHGGGGHAGASGFQCNELPYIPVALACGSS